MLGDDRIDKRLGLIRIANVRGMESHAIGQIVRFVTPADFDFASGLRHGRGNDAPKAPSPARDDGHAPSEINSKLA